MTHSRITAKMQVRTVATNNNSSSIFCFSNMARNKAANHFIFFLNFGVSLFQSSENLRKIEAQDFF